MATTTTTQPTATAAQQERIAELYESRAVPETKKRDPANLTERSAERWIGLLEAYPLKEETSANGAKPKATRSRAKAPAAKAEPAAKQAPAAKAERKPIDGKLAQRAVTMRGKLDDRGRPTSWAKIGFALKLVPESAPKSQAGDAARRAYRQVRGQDAPTGPSDY